MLAERPNLRSVDGGAKKAGRVSWDESRNRPKGYDPDALYIHSTDSHGHGMQFKMTVQPELMAVAQNFVDRHPLLRTVQDLGRNSLLHGLVALIDRDTPERDRLALEIAIAEEEQERLFQEMQRQKRCVQNAEKVLEAAADQGDTEALDRMLEQVQRMQNIVREPYRTRLKELAQQYKRKKK